MAIQNKILATVVTTAMAIGSTMVATDHAEAASESKERCYGVAKKGANDCGTSVHSCAGQSNADNAGDEWVYVPKGLCARLTGGSLEPK